MSNRIDLEQGSALWLALRKTKITATDAPVIMGENRWKSANQLLKEKLSAEENTFCNERMQRGIDLEPFARDLFCMQKGIELQPAVFVKNWAMASLDGISDCGKFIVEIKCPSKTYHEMAVKGKIPNHYYAQLQHQMYVCETENMFYYSFDGIDGVTVNVERDEEYIEKMIEKELEFYNLLTQSR